MQTGPFCILAKLLKDGSQLVWNGLEIEISITLRCYFKFITNHS